MANPIGTSIKDNSGAARHKHLGQSRSAESMLLVIYVERRDTQKSTLNLHRRNASCTSCSAVCSLHGCLGTRHREPKPDAGHDAGICGSMDMDMTTFMATKRTDIILKC
jgi:hypothetical protein